MKTPKFWVYKKWDIERDCSGDFWIAPVGQRKRLSKASTFAEAKAIVNDRIEQRQAIDSRLKAAGVVKISDLDAIRGCGSRFDALAAIVGKDDAHKLLHCLSV